MLIRFLARGGGAAGPPKLNRHRRRSACRGSCDRLADQPWRHFGLPAVVRARKRLFSSWKPVWHSTECGRNTAAPGKRCSSPGLGLGDSPRSDLEPY